MIKDHPEFLYPVATLAPDLADDFNKSLPAENMVAQVETQLQVSDGESLETSSFYCLGLIIIQETPRGEYLI